MEATSLLPPFLDLGEIARNCTEAHLDDAATQTLLDLAQRIAAGDALCSATLAAHHSIYETHEDYTAALRHAEAVVGGESDKLLALLILDSMRLVREKHQERGVASEISWAVNQRHGTSWVKYIFEKRGKPGIPAWLPFWFRIIGSGELYRLGRLEFVLEAWEYPFRAYRHIHTHEVIVLVEDGQPLTDDGYLVGETTWTSTLTEDDDAVIGVAISPQGRALRQRVRLPRKEWQAALGQGDWVLDMHIPREGALTLETLRDALKQAESFFDHYYPQRPFVAYICDSWLFSPQLEAMLPPESNILRWQHEGYLLPSDEGSASFLSYTFGSPTIDLATVPQDTRLRRALVAHLASGKQLFGGRYLLLRSDLGQFGEQPYRRASEEAIQRVLY